MWKLKNQRYNRHPLTAFTMVETIVALTILSISFLAVFTAMRTCSSAAGHTRMLTNAVLLAESLLSQAKLNDNIAFETRTGQKDRYNWQVQIAPTPIENLAAICIQVKWLQQQRQQKYELLSLINIASAIEGK